jgi:hypothetical protein
MRRTLVISPNRAGRFGIYSVEEGLGRLPDQPGESLHTELLASHVVGHLESIRHPGHGLDDGLEVEGCLTWWFPVRPCHPDELLVADRPDVTSVAELNEVDELLGKVRQLCERRPRTCEVERVDQYRL